MPQLSYSINHRAAIVGMIATSREQDVDSAINSEASANMPTGIAVKQGATDNAALLLTAASSAIKGIVAYSDVYAGVDLDPAGGGLTPGTTLNLLKRGQIWVAVEEAVNAEDRAYVRFASGTGTQIGAFRKTPDGVAQVSTLTPSATNSAVSELRITPTNGPGAGKTFVVEFQADSSATAAEWVTGMKAAIAKDAALTALITATGSATLILAGAVAGMTFEVADVGDQTNTIVATTPAAPTARLMQGARFLTTQATAGGLALLDFDCLQDRNANP